MAVLPYSIDLDTITAHIYTQPPQSCSVKTAVLFILHGYPSNARHMKPIVDGIFGLMAKKVETTLANPKQDLVVVTLDLDSNNDRVKPAESESDYIYRRQEHMADSVSILIDRLPSVLSPNYDKTFDTWMVAGVSLGAHAAWMAMDRDSRLSACMPVIGSPDFLEVANHQSNPTSPVPLLSSLISPKTRSHITKHDPVSRRRSSSPFQGIQFANKHVLALAAAQDGIFPLRATRLFMDRIDVGPAGTKRLVIQEGVGHQCTGEMIREMAELVWRVVLL